MDNQTKDGIYKIKKEIEQLDEHDKQQLKLYFREENETELSKRILFLYSNGLENIMENPKCLYFTKKYESDWITIHTQQIYNKFIHIQSIDDINEKVIEDIITHYDTIWFNNQLTEMMKQNKLTLSIRLNGKKTFNTEGYCFGDNCEYTITVPITILNKVQDTVSIGGIECNTILECLLRVIEHELTHLVIFIFCDDIFITNDHGELFQKMVYDLFRHTSIYHEIY